MSLPVAILLVLAGLVILATGGEVLVRGAVAAARRLRVSTAVIGLTIVAVATSLPELAVSLMAALRGSPDVATGNVVGSNIFNLAVILGVTAVCFPPLRFRANLIRFDIGMMLVAALGAVVAVQNHMVSRLEGVVFLVVLSGFLAYRVSQARKADPGALDETAIEEEIKTHEAPVGGVVGSVGLVLLGAAMLTGGAEVLVRGAVRIAVLAGVSERVIALTLVSAGTGLPELATAVMAGRRRHAAVAVGNVIGSNIFNVLAILGTVALVSPVPVAQRIVSWDVWWMLGFSVLALFPVIHRGRRLTRFDGLVALGAYALYIATLL
jgi:cation:H+ antiporter